MQSSGVQSMLESRDSKHTPVKCRHSSRLPPSSARTVSLLRLLGQCRTLLACAACTSMPHHFASPPPPPRSLLPVLCVPAALRRRRCCQNPDRPPGHRTQRQPLQCQGTVQSAGSAAFSDQSSAC
jgi:hypothetical protein